MNTESNNTPYVRYESYETWLLYEEFKNIPGNLMDISPEPGTILSTEMMHNILNTAYRLTGREDMTLTH